MISNGGELLCQKNLGKNWALKMKITYLQYLLIKMDVNNKEVWCKGGDKTGGGKENKISVKLTAPRNEKADLILMGSTDRVEFQIKVLGNVSKGVPKERQYHVQ